MQPQQNEQVNQELQAKLRDLDERYIIGVQNFAISSQQAKMNKIQSWGSVDKLINDFFTFSLITLGVMATVLSAKQGIIGNKALFYVGLGIQTIVVILSSIVRLYVTQHSAKTGNKVFEEFNNRINKIDTYRLAMTNSDEKEKTRVRTEMDVSFTDQYDYKPDDANWLLRNGQKAVVTMFVVGFLSFIASIVFSVHING